MQAFQKQMDDLSARLQVAEVSRSNWVNVSSLAVDCLPEQLNDLKVGFCSENN